MSRVSARARRRLRPAALCLGLLLCLPARFAAAEPPVEAARTPSPVPAPLPNAPAAAPNAPAPLLAYALGALGLSGISVAGVTGFLALNQKGIAEDHCSPTLRLCDAAGRAASDTGRTLRDISTAAWIVGGVGVGLSAYLLLTTPTPRSEVALSVSVDGTSPRAAIVAHF